jgi:diguanylate cyclase (GGDEF)-like protein
MGRIDAIVPGSTGELWVRTPLHLLRRLDLFSPFTAEDAGLPASSDVGTLVVDREGTPWVPTDAGLATRDGLAWRLVGKRQGLASDAVKVVLEDREGSLWIGNDADGVDRWLGRGDWTAYDTSSGLSHDVVWAITRDARGTLWVGTQQGLDELPAGGAGWRHWRSGPAGLPGDFVTALEPGRLGDLWAGSADGGLALLAPGERPRAFGQEAGLGVDPAILTLRLHNDRWLWVGSLSGLYLADVRSREIRFERVALPGEPRATGGGRFPEAIFGLLVDTRGRVWAAGRFGLAVREGERWRRFTTRDGLRDDYTAYLAEGPDGDVWVGYRDEYGVSRLRLVDDRIQVRHYGRAEGLSSDNVLFVGRDRGDRIWVGSAGGADVLAGERFAHLGKADGMRSEDACQNAFFADEDGSVWIGTPAGALHGRFAGELAAAAAATTAIRVVPLEVTLGGLPLPPGEVPEVPWARRTLAAGFTAPAFREEGRIRYRFRLVGLDEGEVESERGVATYPSLPAGSYSLVARARLGGAGWTPPAVLCAFRVLPPWWGTTAFRLALLLPLAAAVLGAERLRHRLLHRRNRELARLVEDRTRELREASLSDSLTGAHNRRYFDTVVADEAARLLRRLRSSRPGRNPDLLLFLVDLDQFKPINDRLGHHCGDRVLVETVERLREALRGTDSVVRWGGDEFLVVSRDGERARAAELAERLLAAVCTAPVVLPNGRRVTVSCAIGWAPYPWFRDAPDALTLEEVVQLADAGLYQAKPVTPAAVGVLPSGPCTSAALAAIRGGASLRGAAWALLQYSPAIRDNAVLLTGGSNPSCTV